MLPYAHDLGSLLRQRVLCVGQVVVQSLLDLLQHFVKLVRIQELPEGEGFMSLKLPSVVPPMVNAHHFDRLQKPALGALQSSTHCGNGRAYVGAVLTELCKRELLPSPRDCSRVLKLSI